MGQDQRTLALPQVAVLLLAVRPSAATQVQNVVLNLKRGASQESERMEPLEIFYSCNQASQTAGVDDAIPAGFLENHLEVDGFAYAAFVVANPAQLHCSRLVSFMHAVIRLRYALRPQPR